MFVLKYGGKRCVKLSERNEGKLSDNFYLQFLTENIRLFSTHYELIIRCFIKFISSLKLLSLSTSRAIFS
jgi:hypothetical protein